MSELEELLQRKKEIEAKIRELKTESYHRCGATKFEKDPNDLNYRVSVMGKQNRKRFETKEQYKRRTGQEDHYHWNREEIGNYEAEAWYTVFRASDKQTVLTFIEKMISDFRELQKEIIEEDEEHV